MQIQINGQPKIVTSTSINELIKELDLKSNSLVIEHNSQIIPQEQYKNTVLQQADTIELLNFVGGG